MIDSTLGLILVLVGSNLICLLSVLTLWRSNCVDARDKERLWKK